MHTFIISIDSFCSAQSTFLVLFANYQVPPIIDRLSPMFMLIYVGVN